MVDTSAPSPSGPSREPASAAGPLQAFQALRNLPHGVALLDGQDRCLRVNSPLRAAMGAEPGDLPGRAFEELFEPDARDRLREMIRTVRRGEEPCVEAVLAVAPARGQTRVFRTSVCAAGGSSEAGTYCLALMVDDTDSRRIEARLRERVKELGCMYGICRLVESTDDRLEEFLQGVVDLLPQSWQFPQICSARIRMGDREYLRGEPGPPQWTLQNEIRLDGSAEGVLEVSYRQPPPTDEPFLDEERQLLEAVALRISSKIENIHFSEQLQLERRSLREANAALESFMKRFRQEQAQLARSVQDNVDRIVLPIVESLAAGANRQQQRMLELLRANLRQVTSALPNRLRRDFADLTPTELRICNMIRQDLPTKQIAAMLHLSPLTVNKHRQNIRRKLGLTGRKANLSSFLATCDQDFDSGEEGP